LLLGGYAERTVIISSFLFKLKHRLILTEKVSEILKELIDK